jgi:hypothetical protein
MRVAGPVSSVAAFIGWTVTSFLLDNKHCVFILSAMQTNASTKTSAADTAISKRRTLREVVRGQGRSYVWLARQTGYSAEHISGVASGQRQGSPAFHIAMKRELGEDYSE